MSLQHSVVISRNLFVRPTNVSRAKKWTDPINPHRCSAIRQPQEQGLGHEPITCWGNVPVAVIHQTRAGSACPEDRPPPVRQCKSSLGLATTSPRATAPPYPCWSQKLSHSANATPKSQLAFRRRNLLG